MQEGEGTHREIRHKVSVLHIGGCDLPTLRRESMRPKNGAVTCRVEAPEKGEAGLHTQ